MKRTTILIPALAVLLFVAVPFFSYAGPAPEIPPPVVTTDLPPVSYISPGNADGVKDSLSFKVSITASEHMVVKGYKLSVKDSGGNDVYIKEEKYPGEQPILERLFIGLGFYKLKKPLTVPDSLSWNGTTTEGGPVPEGSYTLQVTGWDDKQQQGSSPTYTVVVDNTSPTVTTSLPYTVFSPNNDGNKDILIIEQKGSVESEWKGVIRNASGAEVRSFSWKDQEPGNVTWDGKDTSGQIVPDGVYSYTISATDLAGNSTTVHVPSITVDTRDTPISLSRNVGYFSPNGDGFLDTLSFTADVPVSDGLTGWNLQVRDSAGKTVWQTSGDKPITGPIVYDGKDSEGKVLPEGTYTGELSVSYENGNNPTATSPSFIVDLTPPSASVKVFPPIFSPNGDGNKDTLQIYQETSEEDEWTGVVKNADGKVVKTFTWRGKADDSVTWDGRDSSNDVVPNGTYTYELSSRDRAGNFGSATSDPFIVDDRVTNVSLSASPGAFSPNGDGRQDTVTLLPVISDPKGLSSLTLQVLDSSGKVVRTFKSDTALSSIVWDGKLENQNVAPDGQYTFAIELTYDNGNNPKATAGPVTLDTVAPKVTVATDDLFFSPDGDGKKDTIKIIQSGSSDEGLWTGVFLDSTGNVVRTFNWKGKAVTFEWDGKDDQGNRLPDGKYTYQVSSTDQAGNTGTFRLPGITIDTRPTPITLKISGPAFSPNGDGVLDVISLLPQLAIKENVDSWSIDVLDGNDTVRRSYSGTGMPPASIDFDGRDTDGVMLPEGQYKARLKVLYKNGNNPSVLSGTFALDLTPPSARVSVDDPIFSPNGDGRKETVIISQQGSKEQMWTGKVTDASGATIRTYTWYGQPEATVAWDGKDNSGKLVKDGTYYYMLSATDKAGNTGESNRISVVKDARLTPISISADERYFSPNGDGVKDILRLKPDITVPSGVESYLFTILDKNGTAIVSRPGRGPVPAVFTWDGRDDAGSKPVDGDYTARLEVTYTNGNRPEAKTGVFTVDTTPPTVTVSTDYRLFSPDGDGRKDVISIRQTSSSENLWEGAILNSSGKKVRTYFWKGKATNFTWDGKDDNGSLVPDGTYSYVISSTDLAGNSARAVMNGIRVDTRATSGYISVADAAFSPNGDGVKDTERINLYKSLSDGIKSWKVDILDSSGTVVRTLTGPSQHDIPSELIWDGAQANGAVVDGDYTAEFTIEYDKGNLVVAKTPSSFRVDTTPPTFDFSMNPLPFSPDGDGVADTLTMSITNVQDASPVAGWSIKIFDPYQKLFFETSGEGKPTGPFVWDGKSADGELVQAAEDYPAEISVSDDLGNVRVKKVTVPIDVLVFREGNNLKIRISSIQFAPNSADFLNFDAEKAAKNMKTLERLAEILKKYSSYQIRIEGHAVSVYWNDPARAKQEEEQELKPLSKARADAVKAELVKLGIEASRMTTVGMGGTEPIVPFSDLQNRWKDRRVEFILVK